MAKEKLTPENAAKEWIRLKAESKAIESRLSELKGVLEKALEKAPDQEADWSGWKFRLVEAERESFSLAKARLKLDGRLLAPYITKSTFRQIRTTWQGAEETLPD